MTWADLYLTVFLVGLGLICISFLTGTMHLHLPHFGHEALSVAHAGHAGGHSHGASGQWLNFGTVAAFLVWFGGAGYLASRLHAWFLLALGAAVAGGLVGAALVFWFIASVLVSAEENLDPADYAMVGVVGRVTSPIRVPGTGEVVFSQQGTRRSAPARSDTDVDFPKGSEVIVTRYENGIAYVRGWDDFGGDPEV
jgi:membrane protein implicated in regulation of membrane protease activity